MNELKSNEVPQKFAEWLLAMGCHPEVVPPVETVAEMSRGQYYMVWRSLMEKVHPKDVITNKRPQVFCDDIRRCQKKNILNERELNTVVPEELLLWHRHTQLKKKVADAEARVKKAQEDNHQIEDKNNSKLCQRYIQLKRLQDKQRQALLMQQLAEKLRNERANLLETRTIAESLCGLKENTDVERTIDNCITSLTRQSAAKLGASLTSVANPVASSTVVSIGSDNNEEVLSPLANCEGEVLFKQLYERRAGLCAQIPANHPATAPNSKRARSVVCHTESLYCSLALAAMKNDILVARTREKLANTFMQLSKQFSYETCELLVSRCEVACSEARTASIRASCDEIAAREGAFAVEWQDLAPPSTTIHSVDKAIKSKRNELLRLITLVAAVESKTLNVRERLLSRFNSFHVDLLDRDRSGGPSFPRESISTLRQFYEDKGDKIKKKQDISLNLDMSDPCSFNEVPDNKSPTFIDELKLYLNKFDLEKNRKIVSENGEKIWIFESTGALLHDIHTKGQTDNTTALLFPCVTLKYNLHQLVASIERKGELDMLLQALRAVRKNERDIDLSSLKEEEQKILDVIKKRLNENILSLQKTSKNLDVGMENLQFWADNSMRKYISDERKVAGRNYVQYEKAYLNSF